MRTVTWGAGCSLDGFIATPDDGVDWLHWSDEVQSLSQAYWATIDTVLMGRRTFEAAGSPYPGVRNIVFTRTLAATPGIEVVRDDAADFVHALKEGHGAGICVMGGGVLAASLLRAGLIDELGVNVQPVLLGAGIPFLAPPFPRVHLELVRSRPLESGCMYLHYRIA